MTEVTVEVSSQRQAVLDHRIINRTITTNVTITMLVSRTITHNRHMRALLLQAQKDDFQSWSNTNSQGYRNASLNTL